jgi:hypothetical protein
MRDTTKLIHQNAEDLGNALGFVVTREVDDSLLRLRLDLDKAYRPRIDLLWSVPLDPPKCRAIAWALERKLEDVTHLPVVGIEVEGSDPTTKTMGADVANLAALGVPLGLLIVNEQRSKGIYRRAARAIRSVRRSFGDLRILPLEASWLELLLQKQWPSGPSLIPRQVRTLPAGGETLEWSEAMRQQLRSVGEQAGFVVVEPYVPVVLDPSFELIRRQRSAPLMHTYDPLTNMVKEMKSSADLFTESEIDLAWLMPFPVGMLAFIEEVFGLDPCHREHGLVFPELWSHVPVVAFELESSGGKHAGGGLLNLSAYGVLGIAVAPNQYVGGQISAALRTYQPTLGLRNVSVRVIPT